MSYEQEAFNSMTTDGWRWRAPELMSGPALERVTKASDVYAFAMTVIEVCFYHLPHKRSDAKKTFADHHRTDTLLAHPE
jgi:serine/threonine protein kinase